MSHTALFGTARHPFRATLPLRVLRRLPQHEPEVRARMAAAHREAGAESGAETGGDGAEDGPARKRPVISVQDVKDFLLAYCACFIAVSAYLS